jgi:hypothetical protein
MKSSFCSVIPYFARNVPLLKEGRIMIEAASLNRS